MAAPLRPVAGIVTIMDAAVQQTVDDAYRVFSRYRLNGTVTVCTCPVCMSEEDAQALAVTPLCEVSSALLSEYTNSAHDLVEDELRYFLPRYFECLANGEVPSPNGIEVCFARMRAADYPANWPRAEVEVIDAFFAAMFRRQVGAPVGVYMGRRVLLTGESAEELLCMVARAGGDVGPLLRLWDMIAGRRADLRIAALINDAAVEPKTLGNTHWDLECYPELERSIRSVFDWLARAETFERLDAALGREEEELGRQFLQSALDGWIRLVKAGGPG
jgi:hypothetical protein